ncbi:MAG TPA: sulfatase-like hydrolase/transferase, partial [Myxococcota bacterium]|nr:sulfatase-like hydrolase/transferase [Myxococcota bacterium]
LPSTAGLDGYLLYDAARFSGRTVEVTAAKALEKVIGVTGILLSYLVALPAGMAMFHAIFDERGTANLVAGLGVAISAGVIGSLLVVLFFPGLVQWGIEHLPLPGKARLEGVVLRVSRSAAAYRDRKSLVALVLFLSFVVHFTTAVMYYFTARAISAPGVEFWPVVLGSSIQILATVLSPITIAGEGIRELAQLLLLKNMIGPAGAIVSAALGFWAAEALTLAGGVFWWLRPADYRPAWCRVDGVQIDYDEAARAAVSLETDEDRRRREARGAAAPVAPLRSRARAGAGLGLGAAILAGLLIGVPEAVAIAAGGFGREAQVLWYAPLAYAALLGALGLAGGALLALLPMDDADQRGWTPALALLATLVPLGLAIALFRVRRDVFHEQMPPLPVLLGLLVGFAALALALFALGPRFFRSRAGAIVRPLPALALLAAVVAAGAAAAALFGPKGGAPAAPPAIPAALADRPNLILVMVDTLRADHLSCYGGAQPTPHLCRLGDEGTAFRGFSHASWTKPAAASLLTSLVPTSHGATTKTASLAPAATTLAEALSERGYATGGIASNINLAESFGFAQGFGEYHYLAPDYLFGARESSSKLILYQIARSVYFKLDKRLRVGDFYQDAEVVNGVAFDWLERHQGSRFFLFLHYMDPHDPYFAHPYDGYAISRAANQHPDPALAGEMRRLYQGEIAYLDEQFGKLLAKLESLGVYDDTVIALVSDHGEEFQEHGGFWHGLTLYEEQIHVPLLVKWQKRQPLAPSGTPEGIARLIDVAPTLLARAGAPIPPAMQGVDLAVPYAGRADKDRLHFAEEDHEGNVLRALRTSSWKLIEANPGNPRGLPTAELFHVAADPGERANLHASEPARSAELRLHLDGQQKLAEAHRLGSGQATLTAAEKEALQALGYVE